MKKIYFIIILITVLFLNGCQSSAEDGRESVYDIYVAHTNIELEEVTLPEDLYYSGFSSYTKASDEEFELILLKDDIYSELLIEWESFEGGKVIINAIQINYYDFANEKYITLESEEENGLLIDGLTYDETVKTFSSIRIDDIQWIIEELGYEVK